MTGDLRTLWVEHIAPQAEQALARIALALIAAVVVALLARLALAATRRAMNRTRAHANARLLVDRSVQFVFLFFAAVWVLSIFGIEVTAVVAAFGVAGLAVSLAMQDVLRNLVAGLYILIERPFTIGEHIEFRTFSGVVETIELRTTALRTPAGQRVVIPNAMIFAEALTNRSAYGRQLVRLRIAVPLGPAPARVGGPERPASVRHTWGTEEAPGAGAANEPPPVSPRPAEEVYADVLAAVSRGGGQLETHPPALLVESVTTDKLTLRAEVWAASAREAAPLLVWNIRAALPRAEITVIE